MAKPEWKLLGLDISDANFPFRDHLPKNVLLRTLDIFDPVPDDLVGKFDIVHVRAFGAIVGREGPSPVVQNILGFLSKCPRSDADYEYWLQALIHSTTEPGGFLQWDDIECGTFAAHAPSDKVSTTQTDSLLQTWKDLCKSQGIEFGYIPFRIKSYLAY